MRPQSDDILSREPWWASPPKDGETEADVTWGFLIIYTDGSSAWDSTQPTAVELANRKSCRIFQ